MSQAGNYSTSFRLLRYTPAKDVSTGQDKKTFTDAGRLWGSMEYTNGTVENEYGAEQGKARCTIKLRQWVPITVNDRLLCNQFNETVIIEGIRKSLDPVETIVDGYIYEALKGV